MPVLERGDMWSIFGTTTVFMITTNPIRRMDGAVVMGRGIAKEASTRYPSMPYDFGKRLDLAEYEQAYVDPLVQTNVDIIGIYDGQLVGYFMVKEHWRDDASLDIIAKSAGYLSKIAKFVPRVDLNFPGIGNGKLKREDVLPLLEQLPDSVHVWEYT